jgi:3-hydroxyisobutyrate dehydrogenase-like beta-hydroxyacid dehydrogenase
VVRERIGEAGGSLLCAPVSGSAALAQSGRLTVFCSGSAEDYERATPLLDLLAAKHMWLGAAEEAPSAKLIVNLVVIGSMELVAESLALGAALGLSREAVIEQLRSSVISSPFLEYKAQAIVERDYEPTASLGLVRKDLALILRVAERHGVELPATDVIDDIYARGEGLGLRDSDFASVTEVLTNKETQT